MFVIRSQEKNKVRKRVGRVCICKYVCTGETSAIIYRVAEEGLDEDPTPEQRPHGEERQNRDALRRERVPDSKSVIKCPRGRSTPTAVKEQRQTRVAACRG